MRTRARASAMGAPMEIADSQPTDRVPATQNGAGGPSPPSSHPCALTLRPWNRLSAMQGWRSHMEDDHIQLLTLSPELPHLSLFGIFDGHGGEMVAHYIAKHFPEHLLRTNKLTADQTQIEPQAKEAFEIALMAIDARPARFKRSGASPLRRWRLPKPARLEAQGAPIRPGAQPGPLGSLSGRRAARLRVASNLSVVDRCCRCRSPPPICRRRCARCRTSRPARTRAARPR